MRRIEGHTQEKWFRTVPLPILILNILNSLIDFMFHRKFMRIVPHSFGIPIMRILMLVKSAVRIPVIKAVPPLRRCIGIPFRPPGTYKMSRICRVVPHRYFCMKFADISARIPVAAKHIRNTDRIFPQSIFRPFSHAIGHDPIMLRIHSGKEHTSVRTAQGTGTHCICQYKRFACKSVEIRGI